MVQGVLDSLGPGDIKIKISKWGPKGAAYCFSTEGEIDEDFIQSQFGGGRYTGKIFVDGIFRKSFQLNIAERVNPQAGAGGVGDLQVRMMQQQIDFLKDIILQRGQEKPTSMKELAETLVQLKQLDGGSPAEKLMDMFMRGMELGKNGESKDSWPDVLKEALPVVQGFMQRRNEQQQQPEPQAAASLPAATNGDNQERLKAAIAFLKQKATVGVDPAFFVDWVAMNAEQPEYQEVLRFVLASDFSAFVSLDPEIGKPPLVKFFRDLYDGLRSAFTPEDQLANDSGGAGGDAADTASDGATGTAGKSKRGSKGRS